MKIEVTADEVDSTFVSIFARFVCELEAYGFEVEATVNGLLFQTECEDYEDDSA